MITHTNTFMILYTENGLATCIAMAASPSPQKEIYSKGLFICPGRSGIAFRFWKSISIRSKGLLTTARQLLQRKDSLYCKNVSTGMRSFIISFLFLPFISVAQLKMAPIFTDHMVLQR